MSVTISGITPNSYASRAGIQPGEQLILVNGYTITDVLDYRFYATDPKVQLLIQAKDGTQRLVKLKNNEYDDLGLEFETYLMDKKRSCKNKCIFCFIDQLPKGMREPLYFKDDDDRLSFLFGNYITMTNITEEEIDRIIRLKISPINVSVHTTNPELRVKMMANPRSGEVLRYLNRLADAGISLNCQLVLCPGINDGDELKRSLTDLEKLIPALQSIACVPVGLSDYRDKLYPLIPYTQQSAAHTIDLIESFSNRWLEEYGDRIVYPADEFFLKAKRPIPPAEYYGAFDQLENGIGMISCMEQEFYDAIQDLQPNDQEINCSIATGMAAYPFISHLVDELKQKWHNLNCNVYAVKNDCFGHQIVVAGLITGGDLVNQLQGKELGDRLLLPSCMLDNDDIHFLDDMTPEQVSEALKIPVEFINNDGYDFINKITGECL